MCMRIYKYMCVKKKSLQKWSLKLRIYTRFSCLKMYCYIEYYLICTLSYRNAKFGNLHKAVSN